MSVRKRLRRAAAVIAARPASGPAVMRSLRASLLRTAEFSSDHDERMAARLALGLSRDEVAAAAPVKRYHASGQARLSEFKEAP